MLLLDRRQARVCATLVVRDGFGVAAASGVLLAQCSCAMRKHFQVGVSSGQGLIRRNKVVCLGGVHGIPAWQVCGRVVEGWCGAAGSWNL